MLEIEGRRLLFLKYREYGKHNLIMVSHINLLKLLGKDQKQNLNLRVATACGVVIVVHVVQLAELWLWFWHSWYILQGNGNGCGTAGTTVAVDTRDLWFKSPPSLSGTVFYRYVGIA